MIALYEKTIYKDINNGFCILGMISYDETIPNKARNNYYNDDKIHFSAIGYYLPTIHNVKLDLDGRWEESKYGLQYHVESFKEIMPKTSSGITSYLSSGLIKGIGKSTAELIVSKFGEDTFKVIENEPKKLLEIKGITERKLSDIIRSYSENKYIQEILTFLSVYGVTPNKAKKIHEYFGGRALDVIQHTPFLLCEITGFGFKTVDEIARKVNFRPTDPLRIKGGIQFVLETAMEKGDLFLFKTMLIEKSIDLLNEGIGCNKSVTKIMVEAALSELCLNKKLIDYNGCIYLPRFYNFEMQSAKFIAALLKKNHVSIQNLDEHINKAQNENRILLSDRQADAVKMCMQNRLSIITGGPGTGKTTVLKIILYVYMKLYKEKKILLTAPTGRAARKMAESTGYSASTLHAALGINFDNDMYCVGDNILDADFIIIDETSMLDMQMAYYLFKSVGTKTKLLFVGDSNQLPSVGAGNVLNEMINSGCIPVTTLNMVFRQKDTSRIALNAHSIKDGKTKLLYGSDFQFISSETADETVDIIKKEFQNAVNVYGIDGVQVLTPFKVKGKTGALNLNQVLQELINPCINKRMDIIYGTRIFRYGDKVMQIKNTDDVSNGDIGFVSKTQPKDEEPISICFSDGRLKSYSNELLNCIDLAYASTIHKSQGSEYDCVIIPILSSFYIMLQRALIYTAITRAKKQVILIGQKKALFTAIYKNESIGRNTVLAKQIQNEFNNKNVNKSEIKKQECIQLTL